MLVSFITGLHRCKAYHLSSFLSAWAEESLLLWHYSLLIRKYVEWGDSWSESRLNPAHTCLVKSFIFPKRNLVEFSLNKINFKQTLSLEWDFIYFQNQTDPNINCQYEIKVYNIWNNMSEIKLFFLSAYNRTK